MPPSPRTGGRDIRGTARRDLDGACPTSRTGSGFRPRQTGTACLSGATALALAVLIACAGTPAEQAARRGQALLDDGRLEEALELYREARESHPELAPLHHGEGLALHRLERPAEAEAPLRRAIELDSDEGRFHLVLGHVLFELGRPDEALAEYEEMTRLEPMDGEGWRALGFAEYNLRRYPEARAALEKYLAFARDADDYYAVNQLLNSLPPAPEDNAE